MIFGKGPLGRLRDSGLGYLLPLPLVLQWGSSKATGGAGSSDCPPVAVCFCLGLSAVRDSVSCHAVSGGDGGGGVSRL